MKAHDLNPAKKQGKTRRVRRGFAMMLSANLVRNVEALIASNTNVLLPRDRRWTQREVGDIRAALAYIRQEAWQEDLDTINAEIASGGVEVRRDDH